MQNHRSRLREFDTPQEAHAAAQEAANASVGSALPGIYYEQAGRRFISAALPVPILLSIARADSATKGGNPAGSRNRPLEDKHVDEIAHYLTYQETYLVPPIILNASQALQIFVTQSDAAMRPCTFVLPHSEYLYITDGQHRLQAIRKCIELETKAGLREDSIGVTIIEEPDLEKVHQDFFDAAQAKPLQPSLLVEYDGRDHLNLLTKEVREAARIFEGRVELIGNVGKNSLRMFTTNQIKQGLTLLIVGDWDQFAGKMRSTASAEAANRLESWKLSATACLDEFSSANDQWRDIIEKTGTVPEYREQYIHFTTPGFLVICGVLSAILELEATNGEPLSEAQITKIGELAALDWSRKSSLWVGSLVDSAGKAISNKRTIATAVAKTKRDLELPLTEKDERLLRESALPAPSEQSVTQVA